MIRKTISMSDEMGEWIAGRIASGQYSNESEYIRDLIRHDQVEQSEVLRIRKLLEEGEASGISDKTGEEILAEIKREMRANGELPADGGSKTRT